MGDLHTSWNEARGRLLPVLRQVVEPPQAWRVALADPSLALVRRPVLPMLHALCVLETDDQRAFVSQQMLDDWGARPDEVFVEALGNLAERLSRRSPELANTIGMELSALRRRLGAAG